MVTVLLKGVTKAFGDKTIAVDNLDLAVKDKEFVVLLGPSGCGKTTTLRMIAGLEEPTSGEIYIGDELVNEVPPPERNVAMVFQSYALYPHMTVRDNIASGLRFRDYSDEHITRRVREVAELLEIGDLLDRKPAELSGGQKQRVALGRAIAREPRVYLMDEPLANLDAKLRVYMRAELKKLQRRLGTTTIYVTHDQVEAMTMGDKIALLHKGRLQQCGSPHEVYEKPANTFVAGFIGSPPMNLLECSVVASDNDVLLGLGEFQVRADRNQVPEEAVQRGEAIMGIRPADIQIGKSENKYYSEPIQAEVRLIEPLGERYQLLLGMGGLTLSSSVDARHMPRMGEVVPIFFDKRKIYFFDKRTTSSF